MIPLREPSPTLSTKRNFTNRTTLKPFGLLGIGCLAALVMLLSCSNPASSGEPSQEEIGNVFSAFGASSDSITSGEPVVTRPDGSTWMYTYDYNPVGNGSATLIMTSSGDVENEAPGNSGSFSGTMTFNNLEVYGYTFNGSISYSGSFSYTKNVDNQTILTETVTYGDTLYVGGSEITSIRFNFTFSMSVNENTHSVLNPSYSGTLTLNGKYVYDLSSISANIAPRSQMVVKP